MPSEGIKNIGHSNILKLEEIEKIAQAAVGLGITKFRLTGGEPLVRKGIVGLVRNLVRIDGVEEVTMTTNGSLLTDYAKDLKEAGLSRVNISLDTMRNTRFKEITRGGSIDDVVAGINAATGAKLTPIKINTVVMKGFNDDEILDFVQLTFQHDYNIRFIELMPIGDCAEQSKDSYMSCEEVMSKLPSIRKVETQSGVAEVYKYPGARGTLGFISPISNCFCDKCNKIRLTPDGKIKTCLHSNQEFDLKPALETNDDEVLKEALRQAILNKEDMHHIGEGGKPIERNMNKIGG
jgi:cyclic pyranopterin phosphate synthase